MVALQIMASDPNPGEILSYSRIGLPPSLSMDPVTGLISGTITASTGDFAVVVSVTDGFQVVEIDGKNRKKLVEFFDKRLEAFTAQVTEAKGTEDLVDPLQHAQINSTQLSDIVESEEEQVLVPLEVLNDFNTGA